ncbi:hypothetical protein CT0861_13207 [Colletotrichum tofieldiae]|uniref:Uncharacterized protein n=1 Tax=Colletotrichum tofieldiae TaxID=708197 RepID=A0A161VR73_9PEZI|nr:hypothetical protein CT0861_13207 [Colletotrichum tofieldiae]
MGGSSILLGEKQTSRRAAALPLCVDVNGWVQSAQEPAESRSLEGALPLQCHWSATKQGKGPRHLEWSSNSSILNPGREDAEMLPRSFSMSYSLARLS